jgi:hypothetical protein
MEKPAKSAAALTLGLVAASCAAQDIGPHLERSKQLHERAVQHITARDLENCASKVSEYKGWRFGTLEYRLKGPLRPDRRLTCMKVDTTYNKNPPTVAYYSAPTELISGDGGVPAPSMFLWCRFKVTDGAVALEDWSLGLRADKAVASMCGFKIEEDYWGSTAR